ncbi:MAG: DNA/RNA nuclease SfsA [Lentisphaerae bacterium]|nr:MAG: DNA/RNA nuclease SfsA [Lentisphaerota bacterium]
MKFPTPLVKGRLLRRYQRFLADVELEDSGKTVLAHVPNSGRMTTCIEPGWPVLLSPSNNPRRRCPYTLELSWNGVCWIGVNTQRSNMLFREAVENRRVAEFDWVEKIEPEIRYGNSRLDFRLSAPQRSLWVEIKSVTLVDEKGTSMFPDAVTSRGTKHLQELIRCRDNGLEAAIVFIVQRRDASNFRSAREIDPAYSHWLLEAHAAGVEIMCFATRITPQEIEMTGQRIPWLGE